MRTKTSATGSEACRPGEPLRPGRIGAEAAGFTLLELIVALAIASLLLGVVPVAVGKLYESIEYRATIRELLSDLRRAREMAAAEGRQVRFEIDLKNLRYGLAGEPGKRFPEGYRVSTVLAQTEQDGQGVGAIRFFPDGGSSGGSISVERPSGQGTRLRVDWLLGRISQEDPEGRT